MPDSVYVHFLGVNWTGAVGIGQCQKNWCAEQELDSPVLIVAAQPFTMQSIIPPSQLLVPNKNESLEHETWNVFFHAITSVETSAFLVENIWML